jgi:O-antigen polymerase
MKKVTYIAYNVLLTATLLLLGALFITPFATGGEMFGRLLGSKLLRIEEIAIPLAFSLSLLLLFSRRFTITRADIAVLLFLVWCAATEVTIHSFDSTLFLRQIYPYMLWGMIYLALRMVTSQPAGITFVTVVWIVSTGVIAVMGLMQIYGKVPSNHNLFPATGPFHNPGPFSGWIAAALPAAFALMLAMWHKGEKAVKRRAIKAGRFTLQIVTAPLWYVRYLLLSITVVTLVAALLVLPPAGSRAAWIAVAGGLLFVVWFYPGRLEARDRFREWFGRLSRLHLIILALLFVVVGVAGGYGLYSIKRGSADGRVLMWQVTSSLISERPLTGYGSGAFDAHYMSRQAEWFSSGRGTADQVMTAGSPNSPFNETLNIWLKKGAVAVVILILLLWLLLRARGRERESIDEVADNGSPLRAAESELWRLEPVVLTGLKGVMITMLLFAQFSYPTNISSFILQLGVVAALLAGRTAPVVVPLAGARRVAVALLLAMVIVAGVLVMVPQRREYYKASKRWREAHRIYTARSYDYSATLYEAIYEQLRHNGVFLQMYGKTLNMAGRYQESNDILREAERYLSSQIISLGIGDNYRAMGDVSNAAGAYRKAHYMMPYMLYPRYQTALMYQEAGMHAEAAAVARDILESDIKVESAATRDIIRQMEEILIE